MDPVTIITTELGGRPLEPDAPAESAAVMDSDALYSSGDLSVLPPTIVRPVIPLRRRRTLRPTPWRSSI